MVSATFRAAFVLLVAASMQGCVAPVDSAVESGRGVEPVPSPSIATTASAAAETIRVHASTAPLVVIDGQRTGFEIRIERRGHVGALSVSAENLPRGVLAHPVVMGPSDDRAVLEFTTEAPIEFGGPFEIHIQVASAGDTANKRLRATMIVAGRAGSIDESYGRDGLAFGRARADVASRDFVRECAVDEFGNVTLVGHSELRTHRSEAFVSRLRRDATLDPAFNRGMPLLGVPELRSAASTNLATAIRADGTMLLLGTTTEPSGRIETILLQRRPDGSLDTAFGIDGVVTGLSQDARDLVLARSTFAVRDERLAAYSNDGHVKADLSLAAHYLARDVIAADTLDRDGRLLVATATKAKISVTRYGSDAQLDADFGLDGTASAQFPAPGVVFTVRDVFETPSRDILVVVEESNSDDNDVPTQMRLVRFSSAGSLDLAFAAGGRLDLPSDIASIEDLEVDSQGRIMWLGRTTTVDARGSACVARLRADGSFDPDFGEDGMMRDTFLATARSLALDVGNGRFYVCGESEQEAMLARFWNP